MGIPEIIIKNIKTTKFPLVIHVHIVTMDGVIVGHNIQQQKNRNGKLLYSTQLHWGNIDYIYPSEFTKKNSMLCLCITRTTVTHTNCMLYKRYRIWEIFDAALTFQWRKALKFIHLIKFDANGGKITLSTWFMIGNKNFFVS